MQVVHGVHGETGPVAVKHVGEEPGPETECVRRNVRRARTVWESQNSLNAAIPNVVVEVRDFLGVNFYIKK